MNRHIEDYCAELLKDDVTISEAGKKRVLKKGRSALEFFFMLDYGNKLTVRKWAKRWEVSTSTASKWLQEFEELYRQYARL